ncbi:MAG: pilus assembly protein PilM [Patescibacteria group bacterium]
MSLGENVLSVFPPPALLTMQSAGIDISESGVKCVFLKQSGHSTFLQSYTETPLQKGVIVDGDIEMRGKILDVLRSYRLRQGVRYAHASIPEKKAYLYQTLIPGDSDDVRAGVEFGLEAHVPLPPGEIVFDFEIVRKVEAGTIVAVTAYAKRMVNAYAGIFKDAGIVLKSLEVESQALARSVLSEHDRIGTVMILDVGKSTTRIAIADSGVVSFTASVDVGGDTLTGAITKHFGVSDEEAEKMKMERGFLMNKENAELVETLMTTTSVIKDEITKNLFYWNTPVSDSVPHRKVEKVIMCGGNANLRGFPEYLGAFLDVPLTVANVWANAFSLDEYVPPMGFSESLEYATAIGLAVRGVKKIQW